jgi:hypothetical protein
MTERRRCSNSPFMLAPACSRPTSSTAAPRPCKRRGHIAARDALRKAFHHRRLAHTGFAHQDGVVLATAHQDVHHLTDLVVATNDGVHLAAAGLLGQIGGEALEGFLLAHRGRCNGVEASPGAAPPSLADCDALRATSASTGWRTVAAQVVQLASCRTAWKSTTARRAMARCLEHAHQQIPGAHLSFAEHQASRRPTHARPRCR